MKHRETISIINALTVFAASFLVLILSADRSLNLYDEGVILTGAARVLAGDVPHRDFYANYGPGQFYVLAALFKIFQPQVIVARVWGAIIKATLALVVLFISRRFASSILAHATCLFCVVWLALVDNTIWPAWPALTLSLISLWLLMSEFDQTLSRMGTLASGACLGLTTLFRYDIGLLVGCAEFATLAAFCLLGRPSVVRRSRADFVDPLLFLSGVALVCAPVAIIYIVTGTAADFVFDVVMLPARFYAHTRSLPFPVPFTANYPNSLSENIVYFPPLACAAAMPVLWRARESLLSGEFSRMLPNMLEWKLLLIALVTLAFFAKGLVRVSALHMTLAAVPAAITFCILITQFAYRRRDAEFALLIIVGLIGLIPTLIAVSDIGERLAANGDWVVRMSGSRWNDRRSQVVSGSCRASKGFENVRCIPIAPDQFDAAAYITTHTPPNDAIYVGVPHHDHIFVDNVAFYFLTNRRPATKWYHFDPGLQTSEETQKLIVQELERGQPRFVILDSQWEGVTEPNASANRTGVVLLDEYIASRYQGATTFGTVSILQLKAHPPK